MRRFILPAIFAVIAAAVVLCVPKTYRIDKTINAAMMSTGSGVINRPVTVTIKGGHRINWFGNNSFEGEIRIDTLDVTKGTLIKVIFDSDGYGSLNYRAGTMLEFLGVIRMSSNADEIIICLYEDAGDGTKTWRADNGTVIVFPETGLSEIRDRLYEYSNG